MKIVVGILNYNMPEMTDRLVKRLKAIIKYPGVEYIVYDNGSTTNPAKSTTHGCEDNVQSVGGFNRILNIARQSDPGAVWVLTNDVHFDDDTDPVEALVSGMDEHTGIIHPALSFSTRGNPWFAHMSRDVQAAGTREVDRHIDYICPMFSRRQLDAMGWRHDERLISWGADIEACHIAWQNGMKVKVCFDTICRHELSAAIKAGATEYSTPAEFYAVTQKNMSRVFDLRFGDGWQDRITKRAGDHKQGEYLPRFGAVYKTYQGNEFFSASLAGVYPLVERIVIASSTCNWVGESGGNDTTEVARAWKEKNDIYDKIRIVEGAWTNQDDQQNAAWAAIAPDQLDYVMIVDSDEVWDEPNLTRLQEHIKSNPGYSAYCARNHTFIKSPYWMVYPDEPFRGVVCLRGDETGIKGARCARNVPMYLCDDVYWWHFNAVRAEEKTALKKFETSLTGDGVKNFKLDDFYRKWHALPEALDFHPHAGFEGWWHSLIFLRRNELPASVQRLPILDAYHEPTEEERSEHNGRISKLAPVMINQPLQAIDHRPRLLIVMPMAGKGTRMHSTIPKPFISAGGKKIVSWAIMAAANSKYRCHFVFVLNEAHRGAKEIVELEKAVRQLHIGALWEIVYGNPGSQLESVMLARRQMELAGELLISNCDQFAMYDHPDFADTLRSMKIDGALICHEDDNPAYSYAVVDKAGRLERIAEKEVISKLATSGYYYWRDAKKFLSYAKAAMKIKRTRESYVSDAYAESLKEGAVHYCYCLPAGRLHDMGTAEKLKAFKIWVNSNAMWGERLKAKMRL